MSEGSQFFQVNGNRRPIMSRESHKQQNKKQKHVNVS